jgi:hypothetical protein
MLTNDVTSLKLGRMPAYYFIDHVFLSSAALLTNNKHWLTTNNYDLISFYEAEAVEQFS